MGEIPRLTDDDKGYGPMGKEYIAHVDISEDVAEAFERLEKYMGAMSGKQIRCMIQSDGI